jgi:hypothetical protein
MSLLRLTESAGVVWHGVDAVELSLTIPCRRRLAGDPPDALDGKLVGLKRDAVEQRQRVESGWHFETVSGPDPLMVHAEALLRSPYALQCASFLLRVNFESASRPRAVFHLRSHYLQQVGALAAVRAVTAWAEEHLLPLITGRVQGAEPVWNLSRLDLAADVTGVALTRHHLPRFITRTRERTEYHAPDEQADTQRDESAAARMRMDGRALTGYTFGARGQMFARIYDKTRQATPDAPIRETWKAHGYDPERHGTVWRIEFELRRHVLRQFRGEHEWLPDDPASILAGALNDLWRYCTTQWLRLHVTDPTDQRRSPVEPWWDALSRLDFGTGILSPDDTYRRARPPGGDPARLAASLTGTLISLAAAWRIYDLDTACQTLAAHMRAHPGPDAFRTSVHARTSRWPMPVPPPSLPAPPTASVVADRLTKGASAGRRRSRWSGWRSRGRS